MFFESTSSTFCPVRRMVDSFLVFASSVATGVCFVVVYLRLLPDAISLLSLLLP
jgi:hypothetical protein